MEIGYHIAVLLASTYGGRGQRRLLQGHDGRDGWTGSRKHSRNRQCQWKQEKGEEKEDKRLSDRAAWTRTNKNSKLYSTPARPHQVYECTMQVKLFYKRTNHQGYQINYEGRYSKTGTILPYVSLKFQMLLCVSHK